VQSILKQRQQQLRADAILDAAYELMAERGYADVSMDDVAALAGVSKPTLYQHFASKDELVLHVSMRLMRQSETALANQDDGRSALERIQHTLKESLARRAGLWSARVVLPRALAEASASYCEQRRSVQERLGALIDQAKAEGDMNPQLPTAIVVRMLSRLFRADYEDLVAGGTVTPDELSTHLINIVFDGIRPRLREVRAHQRSAAPAVGASHK
jgi:AcrR family transcriptional regulator